MGDISIPTKVRLMSSAEYDIVERVTDDTLPWRMRIIVTNGAGASGRPFTIPTSLVPTMLGAAAAPFMAPVIAVVGYLGSAINLAYLMNVGSAYDDMSVRNTDLLVHESMHVWQGKNSIFALSYVFDSCISQCVRGGSAYHYTPGEAWGDYNVEQQASIVEDWYVSGEPSSGDLWPYVRDHVREGDA